MDRYFWIVFKRIKVIKADLDNNTFFIKEFLFTDFLIATRKRISRGQAISRGACDRGDCRVTSTRDYSLKLTTEALQTPVFPETRDSTHTSSNQITMPGLGFPTRQDPVFGYPNCSTVKIESPVDVRDLTVQSPR